jgi:hypothetical protein
MKAQFGNVAPTHDDVTGSTDEQITYVTFPDGISSDEAFITVTDPNGVWASQSSTSPTWVACSDADLQARLCSHYGAPSMPVPGLNA